MACRFIMMIKINYDFEFDRNPGMDLNLSFYRDNHNHHNKPAFHQFYNKLQKLRKMI